MSNERLLQIVRTTHISEKSTLGLERGQYVFEVDKSASKPEIKDAIELLFNTKVESVRVVNVRAKKKLFRGREGSKKSWKKAYVTLQADQKLDIIGAQ
jgi:large subunit ribosomal protein L23